MQKRLEIISRNLLLIGIASILLFIAFVFGGGCAELYTENLCDTYGKFRNTKGITYSCSKILPDTER
jgi:hypothetical protein